MTAEGPEGTLSVCTFTLVTAPFHSLYDPLLGPLWHLGQRLKLLPEAISDDFRFLDITT